MDSNKDLLIMVALLVLLLISVYQAFEVANLKKTIEANFASKQANLNPVQIQPISPGFEGIPTTGNGCVV